MTIWREARDKLLAIGLHRGMPKFRDPATFTELHRQLWEELSRNNCPCQASLPATVMNWQWYTDDNWRAFAVLATCDKCGETIRLLDCADQETPLHERDQT